MKLQKAFLVILGGCGGVSSSGIDAAPGAPDAAPAAPDAAASAFTSCADIAAQMPGAPSGEYTIDPDGAGGNTAFAVRCEMAVMGGGWTQVTQTVAGSLDANVGRQYLYLYGSKGYESPCTTDAWSWTSGQELTGTYAWFDDTGTGTTLCSGSTELPTWGVGCSNGGGPYEKVLPIYMEDPPGGTSEICESPDGAFGEDCPNPVAIFEKEGCTP